MKTTRFAAILFLASVGPALAQEPATCELEGEPVFHTADLEEGGEAVLFAELTGTPIPYLETSNDKDAHISRGTVGITRKADGTYRVKLTFVTQVFGDQSTRRILYQELKTKKDSETELVLAKKAPRVSWFSHADVRVVIDRTTGQGTITVKHYSNGTGGGLLPKKKPSSEYAYSFQEKPLTACEEERSGGIQGVLNSGS